MIFCGPIFNERFGGMFSRPPRTERKKKQITPPSGVGSFAYIYTVRDVLKRGVISQIF